MPYQKKMKASDLIAELQRMIDLHGDNYVYTHGYYGEQGVEEIRFEGHGVDDLFYFDERKLDYSITKEKNIFFLDPGSYP